MVKRRVVLGLWFWCVVALGSPLARAEESKKPLGAGWVFGYHYGQPLGHAVSLGVILGDARTSGGGSSGPSYEPWPSFPGGGGRGLLLQGEMAARAYKLSAGFAEGGMLYLPPASYGWAVKASYLAPHDTGGRVSQHGICRRRGGSRLLREGLARALPGTRRGSGRSRDLERRHRLLNSGGMAGVAVVRD